MWGTRLAKLDGVEGLAGEAGDGPLIRVDEKLDSDDRAGVGGEQAAAGVEDLAMAWLGQR